MLVASIPGEKSAHEFMQDRAQNTVSPITGSYWLQILLKTQPACQTVCITIISNLHPPWVGFSQRICLHRLCSLHCFLSTASMCNAAFCCSALYQLVRMRFRCLAGAVRAPVPISSCHCTELTQRSMFTPAVIVWKERENIDERSWDSQKETHIMALS